MKAIYHQFEPAVTRWFVAAIVLANNAQRKIAASNGTLTGYGLARAGRILGIIAAVVGIAVLAIFVNQR